MEISGKDNEIFDDVLNAVSIQFRIPIVEIMQQNRKKDIAFARMVASYIVKERCSLSFPVIGKLLGGRDHSTIMHGYNIIKERIKSDEDLNKFVTSFGDSPKTTLLNKIEENSYVSQAEIEKFEPTRESLILKLRPLSIEDDERIQFIIRLWDAGWSLDLIGKRMSLTRERVRQIIDKGLDYEIKRLLNAGKKIDIEKYIQNRKEKHESAIFEIKEGKRKKRENELDKIKQQKARLREMHAQLWSINFSSCKRCGTTEKPHRTNGYCVDCFTRSPEFRDSCKRSAEKHKEKIKQYLKEYLKRPEVVVKKNIAYDFAKYGGNREKALLRDQFTCQICGVSEENAKSTSGRGLYVRHINNLNDHSLENLQSICKKCFQQTNFNESKKRSSTS